jgi:hypothetical protein
MSMRWLILIAVVVAGCADERPPTAQERYDAALKDPINYSPFDGRNKKSDDISGGGVMEFKKDAFKRDVNSVFSP